MSLRRLVRRTAHQATRAAKYAAYRLFLLAPLDRELAVYSAYWGRGYSCNPAAIYEAARDLAPGVRGVWVVKADRAEHMPAGVDHVVEESLRYFWVLARARYFISNANFADYTVKRSGSVHVQTHHGTPLKFMGVDGLTHGGRSGKGVAEVYKRVARWDFSVAANHHSTMAWSSAYPGTFESLEVGYPRNDILVNADPEHGARVREALGIAPDRQVILYAPTHRGRNRDFSGYVDVHALADALGDSAVILQRAHYFYDRPDESASTGSARIIDVTSYPKVEDLYLAADVLVTDYSSTMFDYAVLDRPIVIFASDWPEYRTTRGAYFDITEQHPGTLVTTQQELEDAFTQQLIDTPDSRRHRSEFRARFCPLDDGQASTRVVRRVFLNQPLDQTALEATPIPSPRTPDEKPKPRTHA